MKQVVAGHRMQSDTLNGLGSIDTGRVRNDVQRKRHGTRLMSATDASKTATCRVSHFIDTACVIGAMQQGLRLRNGTVSVRVSVCLYVPIPSIDRCMPLWLWRVSCCGRGGQAQAAEQHGVQQQRQAGSRCQLTQEAEKDLLNVV